MHVIVGRHTLTRTPPRHTKIWDKTDHADDRLISGVEVPMEELVRVCVIRRASYSIATQRILPV